MRAEKPPYCLPKNDRMPLQPRAKTLAGPYALLGGAQVAVGAAAIFARAALGGAPPLAVAASRLCIAALVLLAIAAVRQAGGGRRRSLPVDRRQAGILAIAGVALAAHFAGWIASLDYATVATSTLLVATTPIWTALYDAVVRRRLPTLPTMAAFAAGGAGLAAIVAFNRTPPPIAGHALQGAALALTGGLAMAAYLIAVRGVRSTLGTRAIVTRTYTWAAIVLTVAAAIARQTPPPLADGVAWGGILAMALISQLLGHTAINAGLRWFSPSTVSFTTLIEPVAAAVLALILFGETLSPAALAGGLVLLVAIGVVLREDRSGETFAAGEAL
jgi:drug/metabolite transporter (DMT)-like permease